MRTSASTDPYAVLGVDRRASTQEIREAFRGKVRRLHPDHLHGAAADHEAMTALVDAWELLRDRDRRAAFDALHTASTRPPPAARPVHEAPVRYLPTSSTRLLRLLFTVVVVFVATLLTVFVLIAFLQSP